MQEKIETKMVRLTERDDFFTFKLNLGNLWKRNKY